LAELEYLLLLLLLLLLPPHPLHKEVLGPVQNRSDPTTAIEQLACLAGADAQAGSCQPRHSEAWMLRLPWKLLQGNLR
jgi:hypothetical protein